MLQASKVEVRQVDFNAEFITRMLPRLEWPVVKQAAVTVRNAWIHEIYYMNTYSSLDMAMQYQMYSQVNKNVMKTSLRQLIIY